MTGEFCETKTACFDCKAKKLSKLQVLLICTANNAIYAADDAAN